MFNVSFHGKKVWKFEESMGKIMGNIWKRLRKDGGWRRREEEEEEEEEQM